MLVMEIIPKIQLLLGTLGTAYIRLKVKEPILTDILEEQNKNNEIMIRCRILRPIPTHVYTLDLINGV